jgi:hypothetical protein
VTSAIFGPEAVPPTAEELKAQRRLRAKKRLAWFFFWSALPAAYVSSLVGGPDLTVVGRVWMIGFGASMVWYALSRCPRCRERLTGRTFLGPMWLEKCSSCGFRLTSPQR